MSFDKFVEDVYKPWARENKRSFENNEKYKLPMICENKSLKGKTFAQISPKGATIANIGVVAR